jgi:hypothetical protein
VCAAKSLKAGSQPAPARQIIDVTKRQVLRSNDTAMWVELDYQAETLEAAICRAIVTNLGCGMHPREILDQLIARGLIRDPGNNALEDVVQRLADIAEHMERDR